MIMSNNCPFTVKQNDLLGRYIVSSRDLKEGELILKECPVIVGPQISGAVVCFKCNTHCYGRKMNFCPGCRGAIICSENCTGTKHSDKECEALKTFKIEFKEFLENPQIILPLRCILLKNYEPELWGMLMKMEPHLEQRRDTPIWKSHKMFVEQVIERLNFLSSEDLKEDIVQRVCGILDVNSFELRPPQTNGYTIRQTDCLRGLFLQAALMAHDCTPNAHVAVDEDFIMTVHASVPIKEGSIIYFNYANGLQGSTNRRRHLKEGKYFDCYCKRCSDPTELGTNLSSIRCPHCKQGLVSPVNPLANIFSEQWRCEKCKRNFEGLMIKSTLHECIRLIDTIGPLRNSDAEFVLKKLRSTLSPQHYLILELKQQLVAMYNQLDQSVGNVKRKIELCKDLIPVLKVVEPGISRLQAIALYELHAAELSLANKEYNNKILTTRIFLEKLIKCEEILKDAIKYLLYEPLKSPEGRLLQKAMTELKVLRSTIKEINRILSNDTGDTVLKKTSKKR